MMYGTEMGYGFWSLGHWLWFLFVAVLVVVPVGRILGRLGISPFWALLALVPIANLVGLWALAFTPWPASGSDTDRP